MNHGTAINEPKTSTIGLKTNVNIQLLILLLPMLIGVTMTYFETRSTRHMLSDMWTRQDQIMWSERLATANPNIKVPSPNAVFMDLGSPIKPLP